MFFRDKLHCLPCHRTSIEIYYLALSTRVFFLPIRSDLIYLEEQRDTSTRNRLYRVMSMNHCTLNKEQASSFCSSQHSLLCIRIILFYHRVSSACLHSLQELICSSVVVHWSVGWTKNRVYSTAATTVSLVCPHPSTRLAASSAPL